MSQPEVRPSAEQAAAPTGAAQPSVPLGVRLRARRGTLAALAAALGSWAVILLVFCYEHRLRWAVPLVLFASVAQSCALLELLPKPRAQARVATPVALGRPLCWLLAAAAALVAVTSLAVAGVFSRIPGAWPSPETKQAIAAGVLVTCASGGLLLGVFHCLQALGVYDATVPWKRHGFWLIALGLLLYLPMLGNFALIDPWETHYGEVAREILTRRDAISLWWAHDGWFFSKPILGFWVQAASFSLFGVEVEAGRMLAAIASGRVPQPEWAARLPLALLTLAGGYGFYRVVSWLSTPRLGFLSALLLTTMPYWFFLSHQTMVDMLYVVPMTLAIGLLLCALLVDEEHQLEPYRAKLFDKSFEVGAFQLLFGVIATCAVVQVLYWVSRNLTLHWSDLHGFRVHADEVLAGSPGNCGRAGNPSCTPLALSKYGFLQPGLLAVAWAGASALLLWLNRHERRSRRLLFIAAWFLSALAFLAKGAPALVLPLCLLMAQVVLMGKPRLLKSAELPSLLLLLVAIVMPWFVQMYVRHGYPFIDRLFVHDMVRRAFQHVHDTNQGDDTGLGYYLWQLGYGVFPWAGVCLAGFFGFAALLRAAPARTQRLWVFTLLWLVASYGLFTLAGTKYHHYALPLCPPLAIFGGLFLNQILPRARLASSRSALYWGAVLLAGLSFLAGLSELGLAAWLGRRPLERTPLDIGLGVAGIAVGLGLLFAGDRWSAQAAARPSATAQHPAEPLDGAVIGVCALAAAFSSLLIGRDLFTSRAGDVEGPMRLLHLFAYNYSRPWPANLDFTNALFAFTALGALACGALGFTRLRALGASCLVGLALWWTVWGLDVYFTRLSPHWSQRATIAAYYKARSGPEEPLIAYQMNWKGENFYTGNQLETFTKSGEKFKRFIQDRLRDGHKVLFVTTEHSRVNGLKRELNQAAEGAAPPRFEQLTDKELNNKFFVARVEY